MHVINIQMMKKTLYLRIVWGEVSTDKVPPDTTQYVDNRSPWPTQSLLHMTEDEETEDQREQQVDQPASKR